MGDGAPSSRSVAWREKSLRLWAQRLLIYRRRRPNYVERRVSEQILFNIRQESGSYFLV